MDELIFAGNKYISSRRAGKLAGYTTDYLGQMCRADKMDCRFVGRNWYINERDIEKQKKSFKKEQLDEDKRAIEYKKLELEPMYYSDDVRSNNLEINHELIKQEVDLSSEASAKEGEEVREIEIRKETPIPILSMVESPAVNLRSFKRPATGTRKIIKSERLLPQISPVRFPMVRVLASIVVLIGLLFTAVTVTLQQTVHYTYSDSAISTEFQIAGVSNFFSF